MGRPLGLAGDGPQPLLFQARTWFEVKQPPRPAIGMPSGQYVEEPRILAGWKWLGSAS